MPAPSLATSEDLRKADLPAKLWCRIFEYLSVVQLRKVRLTCSHWRRLVDGDPALMDRVTLKFPHGVLVNEKYQPSGRVPPARSASFSGSTITHVGGWWTEIGRSLTSLTLERGCYVKIPALLELLRSSPHLKRLELDGLKVEAISQHTVVDFNLQHLEELVLTNVVQSSVLNLFQKLRPPLKKFIFSHQEPEPFDALMDLLRSSQASLEELTMPYSTAVMEELPKLTRLRLKSAGFSWPHGEARILGFCKLQPALEQLDTSKVALTDSTFREIAKLLPNLKHLSVRFEWETNDLVPSFLASLPSQLQSLSLEGPELLNGSKRITQFGPYRCPKLVEFELSCFTVPSSGDLCQFFTNCCQIRVLSFDRCKVGEFSNFLDALGKLPNLERLEMRQVLASNWNSSTELFAKSLKYLKLENLDIPEANLIKFLSSFPNLEELQLKRVKFLSDRAVHKFCQQMSKLTKVTVEDCKVGSTALHHMHRYLKVLEQLNLTNITALSDPDVDQMRKSVEIVRFQPGSDLKLKKWAQNLGFLVLVYLIFQLFGFVGLLVGLPIVFLLRQNI